ncbi:peptide-methionine (S)-S-oxide reductase [Candidatus Saccharibacteria bacterium CG10_big_fil_rev_8_21_14_0_10_47_8]|nr:MAG: peptide-methionine (S)-S-oxide reductase [Candidatus Saccharibacteria bacterium CG10_big_fil_rev_8_21_14_0_10_47_8]
MIYDPNLISYKTLLEQFFRMHDPTQLNRQGPDIGDSYRSAIFYNNDAQKHDAQKMIDELNSSGQFKKPIVTTLEPARTFWLAEDYHQKYTEKTGRGMCHVTYRATEFNK